MCNLSAKFAVACYLPDLKVWHSICSLFAHAQLECKFAIAHGLPDLEVRQFEVRTSCTVQLECKIRPWATKNPQG